MGTVWLAHDRLLDTDVAIKEIIVDTRGTDATDSEATARRHREIMWEGRNIARLADHPHAVSVLDIVTEGGVPWLVMEYLRVRSLADALRLGGPLPPDRVAALGAQIADALAAAHDAGVLHRDVKPGNILLDVDDRAHISDFGISRTATQPDTDADLILGTPAYIAPEVARGADPDTASDVYSLGATLYAALEGAPPFGDDGDGGEDAIAALLARVARARVTPPSHTGPTADAIMTMLTPDPAVRPTMRESRDLLAGADRPARPGGRPAPAPHQPRRDRRRQDLIRRFLGRP